LRDSECNGLFSTVERQPRSAPTDPRETLLALRPNVWENVRPWLDRWSGWRTAALRPGDVPSAAGYYRTRIPGKQNRNLMSTHALTFLGEPVSGRNRAKTHRTVPPALNEHNGRSRQLCSATWVSECRGCRSNTCDLSPSRTLR
jgi:hypothetical protein